LEYQQAEVRPAIDNQSGLATTLLFIGIVNHPAQIAQLDAMPAACKS